MEQSEFEEPIDILFDRWLPEFEWVEITLNKFQQSEEIKKDKTIYWVFNGRIESSNNPFGIENGTACRFWFSKVLFKREIKRHLLLHTFDWDGLFDVVMEVKRPSKFSLLMRNVDHTLSNE